MCLTSFILVYAKGNVIHIVITNRLRLSLCRPCNPPDALCYYAVILLRRCHVQPVKPGDIQPLFCQTERCKEKMLFPGTHILKGLFPLLSGPFTGHAAVYHYALPPKLLRKHPHQGP